MFEVDVNIVMDWEHTDGEWYGSVLYVDYST